MWYLERGEYTGISYISTTLLLLLRLLLPVLLLLLLPTATATIFTTSTATATTTRTTTTNTPPPCYDYKRPVCSGASFSRVPASNGQTVASAASQARRRWAPDKRVKGAMLRPGLLALNWYEHAVTFKGRNLLNMCRVAPPVLHKLLSASFGYPCYGDCCRTLLNSILL